MDFEKLQTLFISNASSAIEECKKMICSISKFDSFKDFISFHEKKAHFAICPNKLSEKQELSICCLDCSLHYNEPVTMCLPCFLNGNHKGHNYFILRKLLGICNCGDKDFLKDSSFCPDHQGYNEEDIHPEDYLDENLRTTLTAYIFNASFQALIFYSKENHPSVPIIFDFIIQFTKLGDGFRRLISQTLIEKTDFNAFICDIANNQSSFNDFLYRLIFSLLTDQLFRRNFPKSFYRLIFDKIDPESPTYVENFYFNFPMNHFMIQNCIDFCFSEPICSYNIEHNQLDWVKSCIIMLKSFKYLFNCDLRFGFRYCPSVFKVLSKIECMTKIQPNEPTQLFFDKMFTEVFNISNNSNNTIIISTFKKSILFAKHKAYLEFLRLYSSLFECFKMKPNLKMDKLIQELDKIDIKPIYLINSNEFGDENDALISKYFNTNDTEKVSLFGKFKSAFKKIFSSYPSKYYSSFCNGSSFFLSHPLYDAFGFLLRVDDLCRFKLANFLCLKDYQSLRIRLAIIALKKLLSLYCHNLGLTYMKNSALISFFDECCSKNELVKLNLVPVSILQFLIGLQSGDKNEEFILKEFFAYEIAREIGLFDKKFSDQIENKFYCFLYVCLLIVIDRTIFNDDDHTKFVEERIILSIKNNVNSITNLSSLVGDIYPNKPHLSCKLFNDILQKVATTNKNNNNKNNDNDNKSNEEEEEDYESILMQSLTRSQILPANNNNNNDDDDDDEDDDEQNEQNNNDNNYDDDNDNLNDNTNDVKKSETFNKRVKFYLKNNIACNLISAAYLPFFQKSLINNEISANPNKLFKLQDFEPEETYFFKSNEDHQISLKDLLITPTVFAVLYNVLLNNSKERSMINIQLAMNTLILISKIIKESSSTSSSESESMPPITMNETINCASILDLVSQLKITVFNLRIEEDRNNKKKRFIENTMNPIYFISLMKMKISYNQKEPKSFIDLLKENGPIGEETLERISQNIPIYDFINKNEEDENENEEEMRIKQMKKEKANQKKEEIMNHFQNQLNQYNFSDSLTDSLSLSHSIESPFDKEVCCHCSESGKKEILCYPLYMYRTKFPLIIDKPPLFDKETNGIAVDDNKIDYIDPKGAVEFLTTLMMQKGLSDEELFERKEILSKLFESHEYNENGSDKRLTLGENFVLQFGICPHPAHLRCIEECSKKIKSSLYPNNPMYRCLIDKSIRNIFLPFLDSVPICKVFKNTNKYELKTDNEESVHIINSINEFIIKYRTFLGVQPTNVFVELIKSISGLISTFEIRLRNRPDALDPPKNKILARNLFLITWFLYRMKKKPKLVITNNEEVDSSRFTEFQKLIKGLIECDEILDDQDKIKPIISQIINDISINNEKNELIKEKKICLFLKRTCLSEFFLLDVDVNPNEQNMIDWDEILDPSNLSCRYDVKFDEDFNFKTFSFMKLPNEFLKFSQKPFNYQIQFASEKSFINLLDYNYMINHFDDFDDTDNNEDVLQCKRIHIEYTKNDHFTFYLFNYCFCVYPTILMFMKNASPMILIIDQGFVSKSMPLYVDKYGCEQLSYERNLPIFLNDNNYESLIDKILSGDFSYDLLPMDEFTKL